MNLLHIDTIILHAVSSIARTGPLGPTTIWDREYELRGASHLEHWYILAMIFGHLRGLSPWTEQIAAAPLARRRTDLASHGTVSLFGGGGGSPRAPLSVGVAVAIMATVMMTAVIDGLPLHCSVHPWTPKVVPAWRLGWGVVARGGPHVDCGGLARTSPCGNAARPSFIGGPCWVSLGARSAGWRNNCCAIPTQPLTQQRQLQYSTGGAPKNCHNVEFCAPPKRHQFDYQGLQKEFPDTCKKNNSALSSSVLSETWHPRRVRTKAKASSPSAWAGGSDHVLSVAWGVVSAASGRLWCDAAVPLPEKKGLLFIPSKSW